MHIVMNICPWQPEKVWDPICAMGSALDSTVAFYDAISALKEAARREDWKALGVNAVVNVMQSMTFAPHQGTFQVLVSGNPIKIAIQE